MTGYKTIFFLFFCCFIQEADCQQTAMSSPVMNMNNAIVREEMYVHTDKNVYVAGEILWFKIYNVNAATKRLMDLSKIAYIELIDSLNMPAVQVKISLHNGLGNGSFSLPPSVSSGSYKLRAYTSWMKNGSANDFFQKDITVINVQKLTVNQKISEDINAASVSQEHLSGKVDSRYDDILSLTVMSNKAIYSTREKVVLAINANNIKENFDSAFLSVSVYRIDSIQSEDKNRIENYLSPASEVNADNKNRSAYTNGNQQRSLSLFAPEYNGHIITGKLLSAAGKPQPGVTAYLSVPGRGTQFYSGVSEANGTIRWETKDFYGASRLVVQTEEDSGYTIRIDTPFSQSFSSSVFPHFTLPYNAPNTLTEHSISMQIPHIYSEAKLEQYDLPVPDSTPFYVTADKDYKLDDFTRFTTLEEVMREYIALANVTKRKGEFHLPVFDVASQKMFTDDPLLLLDGVPYFHFNRFMLLDPQRIQKLDVVFHRFYYGNAVFDGILNWQSYDGDLAETSLDPKAFVVDYDGLALQREFYSPAYETEEQRSSHLPDFRNVLYWKPDMVLKENGQLSFYTSDLPGTYVAVVQGISQSGKAGSCMVKFEVKKQE